MAYKPLFAKLDAPVAESRPVSVNRPTGGYKPIFAVKDPALEPSSQEGAVLPVSGGNKGQSEGKRSIIDILTPKKEVRSSTTPRVVGFPEHLGGGQYLTNDKGELIKSPRSQDALPSIGTAERDHIISVALGGTSDKKNLQYLATNEEGRQSGKVSVEQKAINDYVAGKISLGEARGLVAAKNQEINGLVPKQGLNNFFKVIEGVDNTTSKIGDKLGSGMRTIVDILTPKHKKETKFEVGAGMTPEETSKAEEVLASSGEKARYQEATRTKDIFTPVTDRAKIYKNPIKVLFGTNEDDVATRIEEIEAGKNVIYNSILQKAAEAGKKLTPEETQKLKYDIAKSGKYADAAIGLTGNLESTAGKAGMRTIKEILESGSKKAPAEALTPAVKAEEEISRMARKFKDADEFIQKNGLDPNSVLIKDSKNFIVENTAGNDAVLTEIKLSDFGNPKFETAAEYKAGRKITDPIEVSIVDGKYHITDGANRFTQAVANGDKKIPVIMEIEDASKALKPESGLESVQKMNIEDIFPGTDKKTFSSSLPPVTAKEAPEVKKIADELFKVPKFYDGLLYSAKKEIRRALDSNALKKYGESGKVIFEKIKKAEKGAVLDKSRAIYNLEKYSKDLLPEDYDQFHNYLSGRMVVPERALIAIQQWRQIAADIANKAQEVGLEIRVPIKDELTGRVIGEKKVPFSPRENYFPDYIKEDKLKELFGDQPAFNRFLKQMAKKNNITMAEAHKIISEFINGRASLSGHLERAKTAQLPEDYYIRDARKILPKYISSAYDRIYEAREFGGDDSILTNLFDEAIKKGEDFKEIRELAMRALGRENFRESMQKISSFATMYNNITKLSLAAITNLGDIVKPFVRSGFIPAIKAIAQSFTKSGKELASKAGVVNPVLKQFAEEMKLGDKFFKYTGFEATESKLRQISANAGKNYVEILYKKLVKNPDNSFIRRRLDQFGLDADLLLKNGLKENDKIEAAYQAIADTQPISKLDAPFYWQSPTGRILTQYKQFSYKQMSFAREFIFKEIKHGNIKPFLTFIIMGAAVGEGVGDLKAWARGGRERTNSLPRRIIDNLLTVGGLGLATDFVSNLQYGTFGEGFLKFLMGPTVTDITSWASFAVDDLKTIVDEDKKFVVGEKPSKGETQPKTVKKLIQTVPIVGPAVANKVFPTRSVYKARTIPIAEDILTLTEGEGQGQRYTKPNYEKPKYTKPRYTKPN